MEELTARIILSRIKGIGIATAHELIARFGSAARLFNDPKMLVGELPDRIRELLLPDDESLRRAEEEAAWITRNGIHTYLFAEADYPALLGECPDAPILLYGIGGFKLNSDAHLLAVVGSRHCSAYGRAATGRLIADLAALIPDLVIVSGLAYGIDIEAHRTALAHGVPTVAVLAHGLDRIYPVAHRQTAVEMCNAGGGLLSEYPSGTKPDRFNFIARNRIVAGICPATLVVESPKRGGSLVTANLALNYDREVLAVPGRITDLCSEGCNNLIAGNKAAAVTSAREIALMLGWIQKNNTPRSEATESPDGSTDLDRSAPPGSPNRLVYDLIAKGQPIHINDLLHAGGIDSGTLHNALFELEMDSLIASTPGCLYTLT